MIDKAYSTFIKAAISILLVLGLWLVTHACLKKYNSNFDFGNLADWVAALSAFGTLIVAYIAFKSAPNWLQQKVHSDGILRLSHTFDLISDTWHNASTEVNSLKSYFYNADEKDLESIVKRFHLVNSTLKKDVVKSRLEFSTLRMYNLPEKILYEINEIIDSLDSVVDQISRGFEKSDIETLNLHISNAYRPDRIRGVAIRYEDKLDEMDAKLIFIGHKIFKFTNEIKLNEMKF